MQTTKSSRRVSSPKRRQAQPHALKHRAVRHAPRALHRRIMLHPVTIFFWLCVGVIIGMVTLQSFAADYAVHAKVPAPLPIAAADITSPADQTHTALQQLTVTGTCPVDSYVILDDNGTHAGIASCDTTTGTYSMQLSLVAGINTLLPRVFNITDDEGPQAVSLVVWYDPPVVVPPSVPTSTSQPGKTAPKPAASSSTPSSPLIITEENFTYKLYAPGQTVSWGMSIQGGQPPTTLAIDWGDGTKDTKTVADHDMFALGHAYPEAAKLTTYIIRLTAEDTLGARAYFQSIAYVKGASTSAVGSSSAVAGGGALGGTREAVSHWLWLLWPAYGVVTLMAASFWLGEMQKVATVPVRVQRPVARQRRRR